MANVNEVGYDLESKLGQKPGSLPLLLRKNIRDTEEKRREYLAIINEVTGENYTLDIDWSAIYTAVGDKSQNGCRLGDTLASYAEAVADRLKTLCADNLAKETFLDETPARKITFIFDSKSKNR